MTLQECSMSILTLGLFTYSRHTDRMSMAIHSSFVFLPDLEMAKVALSIPTKYRVNRERTKIVPRGAALKQMPEKNASMPKRVFLLLLTTG